MQSTSQFLIRPMQTSDFHHNHLQVLSQLSPTTSSINCDEYNRLIQLPQETYCFVVIEDITTKDVVGSGTLFIEQKLIHHLGKVGHIEDIVVDEKYRGYGLGKLLIEHLVKKAKECDCYKVILNCKGEKVGFYEKCGFVNNGIELRQNL